MRWPPKNHTAGRIQYRIFRRSINKKTSVNERPRKLSDCNDNSFCQAYSGEVIIISAAGCRLFNPGTNIPPGLKSNRGRKENGKLYEQNRSFKNEGTKINLRHIGKKAAHVRNNEGLSTPLSSRPPHSLALPPLSCAGDFCSVRRILPAGE